MRFVEPASAHLAWLMIHQLARMPDKGRPLFPPPLANQNRLWREFANYVRQAEAYWRGATATEGSSSALLYYYAYLNLAKAELLTTNARQVYRARIHHGLSFNPINAQSVNGDWLTVTEGVFPMLYAKHTGRTLPRGTRLEIRRLLQQVAEIGLEIAEAGIGINAAAPLYHTVAGNNTDAWVLLCSLSNNFMDDERHITNRLVRRHFKAVAFADLNDWRHTFGLSRRMMPLAVKVFESRQTFSMTTPDGPQPDFGAAACHLRAVLAEYCNDAIEQPVDVLLSPSLYKSRDLPMPISLARYAGMFYLSSLVRYKPSALDPVRQPSAAWVMDSFSREAPLGLLANFLGGLRNAPIVFEHAGFRT